MLIQSKKLRIVAVIAALVLTGAMLANAQQKAGIPKPQDKMAMGEEGIK
jgi:hypothetical protein